MFYLLKKAIDDKSLLVRILLMNMSGGESILSNLDDEKLYIIVPPLNDEKLRIYLEDQLQLYLCEVISYIS